MKKVFLLLLMNICVSQFCEDGVSTWLFGPCTMFYSDHTDGCDISSGCYLIEESTFLIMDRYELDG